MLIEKALRSHQRRLFLREFEADQTHVCSKPFSHTQFNSETVNEESLSMGNTFFKGNSRKGELGKVTK